MWLRKILGVYTALCCTAVAPGIVYADNAEWELGVGVAALAIPFYPGSSQSKTYVISIPHFLYRLEQLEINNGIETTFFRTPRPRFI